MAAACPNCQTLPLTPWTGPPTIELQSGPCQLAALLLLPIRFVLLGYPCEHPYTATQLLNYPLRTSNAPPSYGQTVPLLCRNDQRLSIEMPLLRTRAGKQRQPRSR